MNKRNNQDEWEIVEKGIEDLHTQMLIKGTNFISETSDILNFYCSCGEPMNVNAVKNEEFMYYRAICKGCGYKIEGIFRWFEEKEADRKLGNEMFFNVPVYIPLVKKDELQKIIFTLEKGELEIAFIDLNGNPILQGILAPIKGGTLYKIYEFGKVKEEMVNIYFDPLGEVRYSLLCLENALKRKILPLQPL